MGLLILWVVKLFFAVKVTVYVIVVDVKLGSLKSWVGLTSVEVLLLPLPGSPKFHSNEVAFWDVLENK